MRGADDVIARHDFKAKVGLQSGNMLAGFAEVQVVKRGGHFHVADTDRWRCREGDNCGRWLDRFRCFSRSFDGSFRFGNFDSSNFGSSSFGSSSFGSSSFGSFGGFCSRRWRHGDCSLGCFSLGQGVAAADQFGIVNAGSAARLEVFDPDLEHVGGAIEHFEKRRRRGACFVQPAVQHLLHRPGGLAQVGQADHAAATLQGMEAAAQRDERGLVVWRGMHDGQVFVDGGEDFVGLFEEDGQQLGVEFLLADLHQPRSLGRGRRGFHGRGRRRGRGLGRRLQRFHFEFRQFQFFFFFGSQLGLGYGFRHHHLGGRYFWRGCGGQLRRRGWGGSFGFFLAGGMNDGRRLEDRVDVGTTTLQLRDEKAQRRQLFRHVFEVAGLHGEAGLGEMLDGPCALHQYGIGTVLAEHQQRTLDLANRLRQRGQGGLARSVAEEGIQRLFDGAEVGADFARHRFEQQPFLRTARHGVEMRQFQHAELFATPERSEAVDNDIGRACEVRVQRLEVLQRGFGEQQRRGHFQRHDFIVLRRIAAQLVGLLENCGSQARVVGLTGGRPLFGNSRRALVKRRQCRRGTGAKAVPVFLGGCEQFAQVANVGQQSLRLRGRRPGHHAVQAIGGAHDGQRFTSLGGAGGEIQGLAQLLFAGFRLAFDQPLDLRTKAHGKAFGFIRFRQTIGSERIEDAQRDPPVGPCGRRGARHLDHRYRDFHLVDALGIILDPLQEAAFEAHACGLEAGRQRFGRQRREFLLAFRRALREIGEKQGRRLGSRLPARNDHRAVGRKQFQRLVGMAGNQVVEIAAQCGEPALCRADRGAGIRRRAVGQGRQQLFNRIGEFRDAVEADDRQRTMCLVHAGESLLQLVAAWSAGVGRETEPGAFQRKVDFSLDPGQRTDIEIGAHQKLFATPWFICSRFTP